MRTAVKNSALSPLPYGPNNLPASGRTSLVEGVKDPLGWVPDGNLPTTPPVPDERENNDNNGNNYDKVDETLTTRTMEYHTYPEKVFACRYLRPHVS
jgi:hypothetical protein